MKRIEVASIRSDGSFNDAYVKLLKTDNLEDAPVVLIDFGLEQFLAASPKPVKGTRLVRFNQRSYTASVDRSM